MRDSPLGKLIAGLQDAVANNRLDRDAVNAAITDLSALNPKFKYDYESIPKLSNTEKFSDTSTDSPSNLAEALLWKLGKWKSYKRFAANFAAADPRPTKTDVVFFAFAKHLRDKENPIYDQHALRALWAISAKLTKEERERCKALLIQGDLRWKPYGYGVNALDCYELFAKHLNDFALIGNAPTKGEIDKLLMPLGQAIKRSTKTYTEFRSLCGWS